MELIKINSDGSTECCVAGNKECERYKELTAQGYKLLVPTPPPTDVAEDECLEAEYDRQENEIVERWRKRTDPAVIERKVASLQSSLAATDYKVIKAYEYALAGEASPYDINVLHAQRQELRAQLNALNPTGNKKQH